jgi:hypothetical protein
MAIAATLEGLPDEILYEILQQADELDWRTFPSSSLKLRQPVGVRYPKPAAGAMRLVSRHWKCLVNNWSRCWVMTLNIWSDDQKTRNSVSSHLAASEKCDLDLWIGWSRLREEKLFDLLLPYVPQIRRLLSFQTGLADSPKLCAALIPSRLFHLTIFRDYTFKKPLHFATRFPNAVIPQVRVEGVEDLGTLDSNLCHALHLEISLQAFQQVQLGTFLRSLKLARKLKVVFPWFIGQDSGVSTLAGSDRAIVPHLQVIRLNGSSRQVSSFLLAIDPKLITKLCIVLQGSVQLPTNTPMHASMPGGFESLTEVFLAVNGYQFWLWETFTSLPMSSLEQMTVDMSSRAFGEGLVAPRGFPRLIAERLTRLHCTPGVLIQCLALFEICSFPVLDELIIQVRSQRTVQREFTDKVSLPGPSCPQLSRIVVSTQAKFRLPDLMTFITLLDSQSLKYLDLSKVESDDDDASWKAAWCGVHTSLVNLEALSIAVPARHTRLRYCFERCINLRILSLAFTAHTPFNVLRLLGKTGQDCMPKLQTFQLELPQDAGQFYSRNLPEMAPHLERIVDHRKERGMPLKEIGILFPKESVDAELFSRLSQEVKLVWGDLCDTIFPYVPPINLESTWDSW